LRANLFSYRVVNLWNRLPDDVISASSVNTSKSRPDKNTAQITVIHWIQKTFYGDKDFLRR